MKADDIPPGMYFISHAHQDADARAELVDLLPRSVEPIVFPPITQDPGTYASNNLINAILACDGMIALSGGHSARSFWVTFECDYARRSRRRLYLYNPARKEFSLSTTRPLDLRVFPIYTASDAAVVEDIITYLREERWFDVWPRGLRRTYMPTALPTGLATLAAQQHIDLNHPLSCGALFSTAMTRFDLEVLSDLRTLALYNRPIAEARIGSTFVDRWTAPPELQVDLVQDEQLSKKRVDDLMVRLAWAALHDSHPEL